MTACADVVTTVTDWYNWVLVATVPGVYFRKSADIEDTHRVMTQSVDDLKARIQSRSALGERIGVIGANGSQWYATFNLADDPCRVGVGASASGVKDEDFDQLFMVFTTYEQLQEAWKDRSGKMTITQLASVGNKIGALFQPMLPKERCNLFWHKGELTATTLMEPKNRANMGLVTATYFSLEDKWVMVFSDQAPTAEKWSVGPELDRNFVQKGFRDGFFLRHIVAGPGQWLALMQKGSHMSDAKQSVTCLKSNPKDFELKWWREKYVITCAAGNFPLSGIAHCALPMVR
eukprot:scpid79105/ scgid24972/ 